MASVLKQAYFHDEAAAFGALEAILWPNGPTCPHCGAVDRINRLEGVKDKKGRVRMGLWKCYHCRGQFTVRKGTIFESSHLKLHQWFQAAFLLCSSKKGISSNQLARTLRCTVKTAWFASHRIREAMRDGRMGPLGGDGKIVEIDETYFGNGAQARRNTMYSKGGRGSGVDRWKIVSLVERGGKARSSHIDFLTLNDVRSIVIKNVSFKSNLMTDESNLYTRLGTEFASHGVVNHSRKEYARGPVSTNTVEGFFSIFKRGMIGTYQHCGERHLHRYLAEFDFRYNNRVALGVNDEERTVAAIAGGRGKRLTYRDSSA